MPRRTTRLLAISAALASVMVLTGCGDKHAKVTTTLREWTIELPRTTFVVARKYDFKITNSGTTEHELIAFKTDLAPDALPRKPQGDVDEEGAGLTKVSDGENIAKGRSQTRSVELNKPGTYIFFCNLPGHFRQGMYRIVTAKK